MSPELQNLAQLLRAVFIDPTLPGLAGTRAQVDDAAQTLHGWGLTSVAFSLLLRADGQSPIYEIVTGATPAGAADQALAALRTGDLPQAAQLLAQECSRLALVGLRGVETHARAVLAQTAARIGDLGTASNESVHARELAWATRQPAWATHAALTEASVSCMRGESDGLRKVADIERAMLASENPRRPLVELAHAVALMSADEWSDAYSALVRLTRMTTRCPELLTAGLMGYLADAALHAGQVQQGRLLVSRVAEESPACIRGAEQADLLYATAVLAPADRAHACFEVLLSLDPGRWPWIRARADLACGAWLRRSRRVTQARAHLLSAQRLFGALDAPVWQRRVHTEQRAAGVRTAPLRPGSEAEIGERLSPQEMEIVRLAAQGLSNREIGARLFLSPRTIGSHLYRIFPKLDVTSRHQLVGLVSAS